MSLIFLNRFYWPDEPATAQLLTDLAEGLSATGESVLVVTSHNRRPETAPEETRRGVRILRVKSTRRGEKSLVGRALDYLTFSVGALLRVARIAQKEDTVVVMTDPPLLGIAVTALARRRGARVVHWVQDVYPEVATAVTGASWMGVFRIWRDRSWRQADACVAPGEDMARLMATRGVKRARVIPNWAPEGLAPEPAEALRAAWKLEGKFIVAYSGNLGRVHDLTPLLEAADALRDQPDIVLVFIGQGAQRAALEAGIKKRGLTNVHFFPPQPRGRLAQTLALGDVHFVTLRPGCEQLVFPSKLYGIAAVGRPILFVGPHECALARTVTERGLGLVFKRDEMVRLATAIRSLRDDPVRLKAMGEAAAKFHRETGGIERVVAAWREILHTPTRLD